MTSPPERIPYGRQSINDDDIAAVVEILRGDWLTQGPAVERFESALAEFCGASHAVAVANGTLALTLACRAAGLGPGDEGVTSSLSFVASGSCMAACGATPRFADIDEGTWNISPSAVQAKVSSKTKVIIPVDFAGLPCDLEPLQDIARQCGATLIVDGCHSLGGTYRGRPVGGTAFADMTCFSFHPVKAMTTGEGGAIVTDDLELARRLRRLRHHGVERNGSPSAGAWYYQVTELGLNARLTDLQCALGMSQLRRVPAFLQRRRELVAFYREELSCLPGVQFQDQPEDRTSGHHLFVIHLDPTRHDRRAVFDALRREGIICQVHYIPIHLQPYYRQKYGTAPGDCPQAEAYYEGCMSLPLFPDLTDRQAVRVAETVRCIIGGPDVVSCPPRPVK